jgi:hypothetical protein
VLAAAATFKFDEADVRHDALRNQWLEEHHHKLNLLRSTLSEVFGRIQSLGEEINDRLESQEYLGLIRKAFRQWDQADTDEKRKLIVQLITNAAGTRVCSDDILRLFLDWIETYHEAHFAVIRGRRIFESSWEGPFGVILSHASNEQEKATVHHR